MSRLRNTTTELNNMVFKMSITIKMILGLIELLFITNSELYPNRIAFEFVIIDIIVITVLIFMFVLRFSKVNMLPNLSIKK